MHMLKPLSILVQNLVFDIKNIVFMKITFTVFTVLIMSARVFAQEKDDEPVIHLKSNEMLSIKMWGAMKIEKTLTIEQSTRLIKALSLEGSLKLSKDNISSYSSNRNNEVALTYDLKIPVGVILIHNKNASADVKNNRTFVYIDKDCLPIHRQLTYQYPDTVNKRFQKEIFEIMK